MAKNRKKALFYVNWLFELDFCDDQNVWRQEWADKIKKIFSSVIFLVQMIVIQKSGNILDMERKVYDSRRLLIDEINKADKI